MRRLQFVSPLTPEFHRRQDRSTAGAVFTDEGIGGPGGEVERQVLFQPNGWIQVLGGLTS